MNNPCIKVAFVIGAMTHGGTERQLLGILNHIDRRKFEPHLFTFYAHGELNELVPQDVIRYCDQTDNHAPTNVIRLPGAIQRRLVRSLSDYCIGHDIDVVYDRTYHVSLVTGAACQRIGIPYINTIVSDPYSDFFPTAGPYGVLKYWKLRSIYNRASQVLCVSDGVRQAAAKFYRLPKSCFQACYNFIDGQRLEAIKEARQTRAMSSGTGDSFLGSPLKTLNVIAIGRLHPQKGVAVLLDAVRLLIHEWQQDCTLTVVGDGPERAALAQMAADMQIENNVRFVGSVEDPIPLLANADVFCLPSLGEGMPNSLIEALMVGVPSIATDCQYGPQEITENGKWAHLVPPGNAVLLSNALGEFASNPAKLRDAATAAGPVLLERFSSSQGIANLEQHLVTAHQCLAKV